MNLTELQRDGYHSSRRMAETCDVVVVESNGLKRQAKLFILFRCADFLELSESTLAAFCLTRC